MKRILPLVLVFTAVAGLYLLGSLEFLEQRLTDARFRLLQREASGKVVLVSIDPQSLRSLDFWPWDRGLHATLLENLREAGAGRVGFDIDFSSRSVEDQDAELEQVLEAHGRDVVLPVFRQWVHGLAGGRLITTAPLPRFSRHATLGSIDIRPDSDGLVRRYWKWGERPLPFALALAGGAGVLEHGREAYYLDYGIDVRSVPQLSYVDVLTGRFDPQAVADRIVIVGATAVELGDQLAVPLVKAVPGPLVQALACESLLQGRALKRTGPLTTLGTTLLLGVCLGPLLLGANWRVGLSVTAAACIALFVVSLLIQGHTAWLVDVAPATLLAVVCFGSGLVRRIEVQSFKLVLQGVQIRRTENFAQHFVDQSPDAILTVEADDRIVTANRAAHRLFGGGPGGPPVGRAISELVSLPALYASDAAGSPIRDTPEPYEATARRADGSSFPAEISVTRLTDEEPPRRVVYLRDITERKVQQQTLRHQATHDALTNLPNRFLLNDRMEHVLATAWENPGPVAVLMLDLDRFKDINDTLGHHTGDLLLRKIADRLQRPLQPGHTIARFGGDEFAVLLPGADLTQARHMAWRLVDQLSEPFAVEGLSLQVDTSVGIAMFPEHGREPDTLMPRADVAMYVAKRNRAGVAVYHPDQDNNSLRHLTLTGALRDALEGGDLALHYQPKIAADTGQVIGAEALVRWTHAEHGRIPPDEFIALAENSGLIRPLTLWVLETGLSQVREWRHQGIELGLSINVSARNLLEEALPRTLERLLRETGVPADKIMLEITESMIMEDPEKALQVLTELSGLGVGISIDDFGTGYSSLGYLKRLPAQEIKIDRSFVCEMDRSEDDATIVRSTIELAHNLGLVVVAEGVETRSVWNRLVLMGCDYGQGYYFSRPLTPEQFLMKVRTGDALSFCPI